MMEAILSTWSEWTKRSLRASKSLKEKRTQLSPSSALPRLSKTPWREDVTLYCLCPEPFWWKADCLWQPPTEKLSARSASVAARHPRMALWPRQVWMLSRKCSANSAKGAHWKLSSTLAKMTLDGETDLQSQS